MAIPLSSSKYLRAILYNTLCLFFVPVFRASYLNLTFWIFVANWLLHLNIGVHSIIFSPYFLDLFLLQNIALLFIKIGGIHHPIFLHFWMLQIWLHYFFLWMYLSFSNISLTFLVLIIHCFIWNCLNEQLSRFKYLSASNILSISSKSFIQVLLSSSFNETYLLFCFVIDFSSYFGKSFMIFKLFICWHFVRFCFISFWLQYHIY